MANDTSTYGDLKSRDFYCRSLHLSANATRTGYQNGLDYYLVRPSETPVQLASTMVTSDATGVEGEVRIYGKAVTDASASTLVASFKPSAVTLTGTRIVAQTTSGTSILTMTSAGITIPGLLTVSGAASFGGTVTVGDGVALPNRGGAPGGSSNVLSFFEQGWTQTVAVAASTGTTTTSVAIRASRIGSLVVVTVPSMPAAVGSDTAFRLVASDLLSGRTDWRPPAPAMTTVRVAYDGDELAGVATLDASGGLVYERAPLVSAFDGGKTARVTTPASFVFDLCGAP